MQTRLDSQPDTAVSLPEEIRAVIDRDAPRMAP
jgi:hypothetical protein